MKLVLLSITTFFIALASATLESIHRAANSESSKGRVLIGGPGYIWLATWNPEPGVGFRVLIEKKVPISMPWMVFTPPGRLYVADEGSNVIRLYDVNSENSNISDVEDKTGSFGVVHLEFSKDKTRLFASAFHSGTIDVWNIEGGGLDLMKTVPCPRIVGGGPARPHQANLDPTGRFLVVNDPSVDSVIIIDTKDDAYEVMIYDSISMSGCGPRHGVFYPQGADKATSYIVVCEKSKQVAVLSVKYESDRLVLEQFQRASVFSNDSPPANETNAAPVAITLMPDNQNLYVSNRGMGNETDYISFFRIDTFNASLPRLGLSGMFPAHGTSPWMISPSKDGEWLFTANLAGDEAGVFALKVMIDGTLKDLPEVALWFYVFGDSGHGPRFIRQIE